MSEIQCMILTPFSEEGLHLKNVLNEVLSELGITVLHPSDISSEKPLLQGVLDLLTKADLVLADVSDLNPNILFEIGTVQGTRSPLIIMADFTTKIPVSLSSIPLIRYDRKKGLHNEFSQSIISEIKKFKKIADKIPKQKQIITPKNKSSLAIKLLNPFDFDSAESLIFNLNLLADLFVPPPCFEQICGPDSLLITGPRGSGKTTLLQMMRFQQNLEKSYKSNNFAGFYINFNTSFHYMGAEEAILLDQNRMMTYFNLQFFRSLINDLDILLGYGKISSHDEEEILTLLLQKKIIPSISSCSFSSVSSIIDLNIQLTRSGQEIKHFSKNLFSSSDFLIELAHNLCKKTQLFSNYRIAYLIDDYANDWLPEKTSQLLNNLIFRKSSPDYVFKVTIIPGRLLYSLGTSHYLAPGFDFYLYDITPKYNERKLFLQKILDRRLCISNSPMLSESYLKSGSVTSIVDYSGIDGLSRICMGNNRTIISIFRRIFLSDTDHEKPISSHIQNQVIQAYSLEYLDSLRMISDGGDQIFSFVMCMMEYCHNFYLKSRRKNNNMVFNRGRIILGLRIKNFKRISSESEFLFLRLIRFGIFQQTNSHEFVINKMFYPAFKIPVKVPAVFFELSGDEFESMLTDPQKFWKNIQTKTFEINRK